MHVQQIGREYYQILPPLRKVMEKIDAALGRPAFSAGLYLGEQKGKEFKPGLALLNMVSRASNCWVSVDDNAEWLFLCGRDIFAKSVVKSNVKSGIVLVANKRGEILGYGRITGDVSKKNSVYVKNILDRGDYLRRELVKRQG